MASTAGSAAACSRNRSTLVEKALADRREHVSGLLAVGEPVGCCRHERLVLEVRAIQSRQLE